MIEEEDENADNITGSISKGKRQRRNRSTTQSSQETSNSLSSRGDLIFDDEDEDAVPLDDEFAVVLARRNTLTSDEHLAGSGGRSRRTTSGQSSRSGKARERKESRIEIDATRNAEIASMAELSKEEQEAEAEEELEIVRRRSAAHQLAVNQGLARASVSLDGIK